MGVPIGGVRIWATGAVTGLCSAKIGGVYNLFVPIPLIKLSEVEFVELSMASGARRGSTGDCGKVSLVVWLRK